MYYVRHVVTFLPFEMSPLAEYTGLTHEKFQNQKKSPWKAQERVEWVSNTHFSLEGGGVKEPGGVLLFDAVCFGETASLL